MEVTLLINCSNLKVGGGLQVADSICNQLRRYPYLHFIVVLSSYLSLTKDKISHYSNVEVFTYDIPDTIQSIIRGRDIFLDSLVDKNAVDAVLTVFGPSRWCPKVPHLSGFAMPHIVIPESPFFKRQPIFQKLKWKFWCKLREWSFKKSADYFWTENPYISRRLERLLGDKKVFTVTNYYNQVFDEPELWGKKHTIPEFDGVTCLTVSSYYAHKNLKIIIEVVRIMRVIHPDFHIRFVLTIDEDQMLVPEDVHSSFIFIGKVDVSECPHLYKQSDIMFMPSLLECFTATYPEAMRMAKPIVTTDLEFARGLCSDAACYYSAVDPYDAAEALYKVATDKAYARQLVDNGKRQLAKFDNYEQRTEKLIKILEQIVNN